MKHGNKKNADNQPADGSGGGADSSKDDPAKQPSIIIDFGDDDDEKTMMADVELGDTDSAMPVVPSAVVAADDDDDDEKTAFAVLDGDVGLGLAADQLAGALPPVLSSTAGLTEVSNDDRAKNAFAMFEPIPPVPPVEDVGIPEVLRDAAAPDDDDDDEKTAFAFLDGPPSVPVVEDDDDDEKTAFAFLDGPSSVPVVEDDDDEKTAFAVLDGTPAAAPAADDDDDDEKTAFAALDSALPVPALGGIGAAVAGAASSLLGSADDDDDDDEKTAFALIDDTGASTAAADALAEAAASAPSPLELAAAEARAATEAAKAQLAGLPNAKDQLAADIVGDDRADADEQTIIFDEGNPPPKSSAPANVASKDAKPAASAPEKTGVTGATGVTGSSAISAWSSGTNTGVTQRPGSAPQVTKPEPGVTIAQYELIRLLGEGGMGAVYLARDIRLGRRVAIKFLHTANKEMTERFVIEAQATARVEHENIVSIYEVGMWGDSPYMVLQFLQGNELSKIIPRGKAMPIPRVVELMTPVLRALDCAHKEKIVHRDLKPDNIFITNGGVTKVLDFGIAKVVQGDEKASAAKVPSKEDLDKETTGNTNLTRHGTIVGTMPYMSPEQWGNGVPVDQTTDIWAVGIMMYKMLCGKHPLYPKRGTELMVTGFIDEPTPSLAEFAPDIPKELVAVIDKALLKDKSKRYGTALAMLRDLEPFQPGRFTVGKPVNIEESPYAGLSSFQEEDASRFFGRNREIASMSQKLREQPLMAVVGPSGVGKSSFVRAGVVPALKASGDDWDISVVRPGRSPLMALAGLLNQVTQGSGAATSLNIGDEVEQQKKRAERLKTEPGYLGMVLRRHARRTKTKIMLFVDQFEELYTLVGDLEERLAFTACLSAAADDPTSPMRVVVSIRSDFLDRCVEDVHFMNEMSQGLFFITAPTREGMRESLTQPAQMAGYKFEDDGIVEDMLDHLSATSGALPLLQFTADKLWGERDPARKLLTKKSYDALGGVSGALASHADQVLKQVSSEQRKLVQAVFKRLVTSERTRAIVPMDELREQLGDPKDTQRVIDQLVKARLLVVQTGAGGGGATVEIVHESLIHGWPQLRRWLDEGQEDAAFLEQLRNAARQWSAKKKDAGLLWRGEMASEARRFVARYRGDLPKNEQSFLKAVVDQATRAARVKRRLLIAAAVLACVLLAAAAVALYVINESAAETEQQAIAAKKAEKKATVAAAEAKLSEKKATSALSEVERQKEQAEKAKTVAEKAKEDAEKAKVVAERALADAKRSSAERELAQQAESKALDLANQSKEQLQQTLVKAQAAEKRAVAAAREASVAKKIAEQQAREANAARKAATASNANLQVALKENERRRREAERAKEAAIKKLQQMTRGGIVEVLK